MCQWKFLVLRYRAKKSVSKRVSAPAISLVASDLRSSVCRAERAVAPLRLSSPSRGLLVECSDWQMSFARAAGRPSSVGTRWRQDRSDACAMLSLLDRACGSLCGTISALRVAAMIGGVWPPPAGRAVRCQHPGGPVALLE